MAGMKFEYDENGGKFYYFLLSFYALVLVPATYYMWPEKERKRDKPHPEDTSNYSPCRVKYQLLHANEPYKRKKQAIVKIVLLAAWIVFAVLAFRVSQIETEHKEYDPYIVLNVDRGATDKEIRKQYRELSKVMHPDKGGDPEQFKELIKAYKSLTDEETKKNWEEYGNPDGPGVTHFGIALPKWMVDDKNSMVVLGIYVLVFIIILPIVVGVWWYKSIKYTTDKIFIITAQMYWAFLLRTVIIIPKRAIMILAASFEFDRNHNPEVVERASDNIEIPQLMKNLPNLQEKNRELPLCCPYSVKARALLHAHLSRLELPEKTLLKDKELVVSKSPYLLNEMISIVAQIVGYTHMKGQHQPRLDTIENIMRLSPMIVQAIWDTKHSLLQLPHIDEGHLRHFVTKKIDGLAFLTTGRPVNGYFVSCLKRNITTIKQFVASKDSDRRSILRHLTDDQYDDIMRVCETYPHIEMKAKTGVFDDEDEQTITVGAIVTLNVTLVRHNLRVLFDKEHYEEKLEANEQQPDGDNEDQSGEGSSEAAVKRPEVAIEKATAAKPAWKKQEKKGKHAKAKPKAKQTKQQVVKATAPTADQKIEELAATTETQPNDESDNEDVDNIEPSDTEARSSPQDTLLPPVAAAPSATAQKSKDEDFFEKFQQQQKKRESLEAKQRISHRVFCPYFPSIKQECWWLYVCDRKSRSLISAPVYICTLKDKEEFEVKFTAPKKVGIYSYAIMLRSDSYMDFDVCEYVKIDVKPAIEIEDHPQWNIEEDLEKTGQSNGQDDDEYATESDQDNEDHEE